MTEAEAKLAAFQAERAPNPDVVKHFSSAATIHGAEPYVKQDYPTTLFALVDGKVTTKVVYSEEEAKAQGPEWTDSPLRVAEAAGAAKAATEVPAEPKPAE